MQLDDFFQGLAGDLQPIRDVAFRLGPEPSGVSDDAILLSHRPHVAPQSYAMRLYKPLTEQTLDRYQQVHRVALSHHYMRILRKLNGAHIFEFSLYGVPRSMATDTPSLNRSGHQPYDIACANTDWKREYRVPGDWFHFGGGPFSYDEIIGYFLDPAGRIYSVRKNGERLRSWQSFSEFLEEELRRAEAAYPAHEAFMAKIIAESKIPKPWWRKMFMR